MRRIIILIIAFSLAFPAVACAKHCGPLWAVWTHSEDSDECAIKTAFWAVTITAAVSYAAWRLTRERNPLADNRLNFEPAIWLEEGPGPEREVMPFVGFTIRW